MNTFTATPKDVENAFATVFPHVGTDAHLPLLTVVHVEVAAAAMVLTATDRYTAAIYRADLNEWTPKAGRSPRLTPRTVDVFARDLRRLFAFGKDSRREPARWTFAPGRVSVEFAGGETSSIRTVEVGDFPNVRGIFAEQVDRPDTFAEVANLHPEQLDKFTRSAYAVRACDGSKAPLRMWAAKTPLKPVLVTVGASFAGMVMPCRIEDLPLDMAPFLAAPALAAGAAS